MSVLIEEVLSSFGTVFEDDKRDINEVFFEKNAINLDVIFLTIPYILSRFDKLTIENKNLFASFYKNSNEEFEEDESGYLQDVIDYINSKDFKNVKYELKEGLLNKPIQSLKIDFDFFKKPFFEIKELSVQRKEYSIYEMMSSFSPRKFDYLSERKYQFVNDLVEQNNNYEDEMKKLSKSLLVFQKDVYFDKDKKDEAFLHILNTLYAVLDTNEEFILTLEKENLKKLLDSTFFDEVEKRFHNDLDNLVFNKLQSAFLNNITEYSLPERQIMNKIKGDKEKLEIYKNVKHIFVSKVRTEDVDADKFINLLHEIKGDIFRDIELVVSSKEYEVFRENFPKVVANGLKLLVLKNFDYDDEKHDFIEKTERELKKSLALGQDLLKNLWGSPFISMIIYDKNFIPSIWYLNNDLTRGYELSKFNHPEAKDIIISMFERDEVYCIFDNNIELLRKNNNFNYYLDNEAINDYFSNEELDKYLDNNNLYFVDEDLSLSEKEQKEKVLNIVRAGKEVFKGGIGVSESFNKNISEMMDSFISRNPNFLNNFTEQELLEIYIVSIKESVSQEYKASFQDIGDVEEKISELVYNIFIKNVDIQKEARPLLNEFNIDKIIYGDSFTDFVEHGAKTIFELKMLNKLLANYDNNSEGLNNFLFLKSKKYNHMFGNNQEAYQELLINAKLLFDIFTNNPSWKDEKNIIGIKVNFLLEINSLINKPEIIDIKSKLHLFFGLNKQERVKNLLSELSKTIESFELNKNSNGFLKYLSKEQSFNLVKELIEEVGLEQSLMLLLSKGEIEDLIAINRKEIDKWAKANYPEEIKMIVNIFNKTNFNEIINNRKLLLSDNKNLLKAAKLINFNEEDYDGAKAFIEAARFEVSDDVIIKDVIYKLKEFDIFELINTSFSNDDFKNKKWFKNFLIYQKNLSDLKVYEVERLITKNDFIKKHFEENSKFILVSYLENEKIKKELVKRLSKDDDLKIILKNIDMNSFFNLLLDKKSSLRGISPKLSLQSVIIKKRDFIINTFENFVNDFDDKINFELFFQNEEYGVVSDIINKAYADRDFDFSEEIKVLIKEVKKYGFDTDENIERNTIELFNYAKNNRNFQIMNDYVSKLLEENNKLSSLFFRLMSFEKLNDPTYKVSCFKDIENLFVNMSDDKKSVVVNNLNQLLSKKLTINDKVDITESLFELSENIKSFDKTSKYKEMELIQEIAGVYIVEARQGMRKGYEHVEKYEVFFKNNYSKELIANFKIYTLFPSVSPETKSDFVKLVIDEIYNKDLKGGSDTECYFDAALAGYFEAGNYLGTNLISSYENIRDNASPEEYFLFDLMTRNEFIQNIFLRKNNLEGVLEPILKKDCLNISNYSHVGDYENNKAYLCMYGLYVFNNFVNEDKLNAGGASLISKLKENDLKLLSSRIHTEINDMRFFMNENLPKDKLTGESKIFVEENLVSFYKNKNDYFEGGFINEHCIWGYRLKSNNSDFFDTYGEEFKSVNLSKVFLDIVSYFNYKNPEVEITMGWEKTFMKILEYKSNSNNIEDLKDVSDLYSKIVNLSTIYALHDSLSSDLKNKQRHKIMNFIGEINDLSENNALLFKGYAKTYSLKKKMIEQKDVNDVDIKPALRKKKI